MDGGVLQQQVDQVSVVAVESLSVVLGEAGQPPIVIAPVERSEVAAVVELTQLVEHTERPVVHVAGGNQGPAGAQGLQGIPGATAGQILQAVAGATLGGHRAIFIDAGRAQYADSAAPSAERVAGITLGAAAEDAVVNYQTAGAITEPSWNWNEGPVFLGANGMLTQTPPSSGAVVELGVALAPTTIIVRIGPAVFLQ